MKLSGYPELAVYRHLRELLARQVDMQFEDVVTLLQLSRRRELGAGLPWKAQRPR